MILAETQSEVWAAIIVSLGIAVTGIVVTTMTTAFQLFMSYRASNKVEAVRTDLEKTNAANTSKLDEIAKTGTETYKAANHNFQKMQEEAAADRKALAMANEEIAKVNKEFANLSKTLALMIQAKHESKPATPAPVATPGLVVEGEIHDLVISNKPVEEKKP